MRTSFSQAVKIALPAAFSLIACAAALPAHADTFGYATTFTDNDSLVKVDLTTQTSTIIGPLGTLALPESLALANDGSIYVTDSAGNFYHGSTTTGATTLIGNTGRGNIEGIHFLNGQLLGVDFARACYALLACVNSLVSIKMAKTT